MSTGALLDLTARGRKDAYFLGAVGGARQYFGSAYERRGPSAREIRIQMPETGARFGHWVDIELPRTGDVLMSADIRIQMPTWLPPAVAALNRRNGVLVELESRQYPGVYGAFGWTNGIANYLIDRWALFADSVMLVEGWGDFNSWFPDMETTQMKAPLIHAATGTHSGTALGIQRNATPPELVFRVPIPGCQRGDDVGLPLCALRGHRLYLRLWLRDKTALVESGELTVPGSEPVDPSSGVALPIYETCPAPWGGRAGRYFKEGSPDPVEFTTVQEWQVGQPYIYGRFAVLHLDEEMRAALAETPQDITFRQQRRESFTIRDEDWATAVVGGTYRQLLGIHGFFQALFVGIISDARLLQNKYRDIDPPGRPVGSRDWLLTLGLNVNGVDRIFQWPPKKFQELANATQLGRDVEAQLYYLIFGINPDWSPAGTCNLTQTQKVLLTAALADVLADPATGTKQAEASVLGLSWNVLRMEGGVGAVRFEG
jgi:hypothetical protein